MVAYVKSSMCENHENMLKYAGTAALYFKVPDMIVSM